MPAAGHPSGARRILVYGVTGSGKSTAALRLGERLGLPVTLVDELTWLPGWVPVSDERQRELIADIASGEEWILDSAYGAWLHVVLPRTELVVGLDYPRWFSLQRLVRRTVSSALSKEPRCNGNTESWRGMFSRTSIIRWHFASFARKRDRMRRWAHSADGPPIVLLKNSTELDAWVAALRTEQAPGGPAGH